MASIRVSVVLLLLLVVATVARAKIDLPGISPVLPGLIGNYFVDIYIYIYIYIHTYIYHRSYSNVRELWKLYI